MRKRSVEQWIETRGEALFPDFEREMSTCEGDFAERERRALAVANAVVRRWLQKELTALAAGYGEEVNVDGQRYRRHAEGTVRYHTLCGGVEVSRHTYRQVGVHNGRTLVPLELEAGIAERATPALALSVLQAFAMMPLRHYEGEMRAAHRNVPSRSTLERIAKRTGAQIRDELPVIEPALRKSEVAPRGLSSISVGIDRTTIPMAEQLATSSPPRNRPRLRRPPPPISMAYRMAYVGTVALNDAGGAVLATKRVSATANEGPDVLMERLGAEIEHIRRHAPTVPIVVVQDGAPELWNLVETWFEDLSIPIAMKLIDRYHVEERLAQLAELLEPRLRARQRLFEQWRELLDRNDMGIRRVCEQVQGRMYEWCRAEPQDMPGAPFRGWDDSEDFPWHRPARLPDATLRAAEGHIAYCYKNRDKMHYRSARKRGLPIGSGATEGACKSVIGSRFKRSGQRWFEDGASPCLHLRTLLLNDRLQGAFELHVNARRGGLGSRRAI